MASVRKESDFLKTEFPIYVTTWSKVCISRRAKVVASTTVLLKRKKKKKTNKKQ